MLLGLVLAWLLAVAMSTALLAVVVTLQWAVRAARRVAAGSADGVLPPPERSAA